MNRFYQIRRMRGAAFLILTGVLALLNQWHTLRWSQSWPFYVILLGVLILAERAAWMADLRDRRTGSGSGPETIQPPPPENPNQEER